MLHGVDYFDGVHARAQRVALRLEGDVLVIEGREVARRTPLADVQLPERTQRGARVAHLGGGGSLVCDDGAAWDRWLHEHGRRNGWVVRLQQSWTLVAVSLALLVIVVVLLQMRGIPWAARAIVAAIPASVDASFGDAALEALDRDLLKPTRLSDAEQMRIRAAFERALASRPAGSVPAHRLVFRRASIGPNAFTLPGGTIVLTDALVQLVDADTDVLVGVLGHEVGHLRHRHGMRMLVQAAAIGTLASLVIGDLNTLLAAAPALLAQAAYSRDAEREADAESVAVLRSSGRSPAVMVGFFERIDAWRRVGRPESSASAPALAASAPMAMASAPRATHTNGDAVGVGIASHPTDAERVAFFRAAAREATPPAASGPR